MKPRIWEMNFGKELPDSIFQYRVMSVEHLSELQDDFTTLDAKGNISDNPVFRGYIAKKQHRLPDTFKGAKSIIAIAVFTPLVVIPFHYDGSIHEILLAHYYDNGISEEQLKNTILNKIIKNNGFRVENAGMHVLLKRLAVRTGLGKYGRNNLCYVEGMGSFIQLFAFFTDYSFHDDNWGEVQLMDTCNNCRICLNRCPTGSISEHNFVIDVGKCLPLYNEVPGTFPDWLKKDSHSTLMGCLRCQITCPANRDTAKKTQTMDAITEQETKQIIDGVGSDELYNSLSKKLRLFTMKEASYFFPVISRNLRALLIKTQG